MTRRAAFSLPLLVLADPPRHQENSQVWTTLRSRGYGKIVHCHVPCPTGRHGVFLNASCIVSIVFSTSITPRFIARAILRLLAILSMCIKFRRSTIDPFTDVHWANSSLDCVRLVFAGPLLSPSKIIVSCLFSETIERGSYFVSFFTDERTICGRWNILQPFFLFGYCSLFSMFSFFFFLVNRPRRGNLVAILYQTGIIE